jgi:predicted cobalt transporter CbtA
MKTFWTSKTFWYNTLTLVVLIATYVFGYQPSEVVTHNVQTALANPFVIAAVNFVLRWLTTKGIVVTLPATPVTIDSLPQ